jgi:threonine/homoserine/homoserine lactone efflux protein
MSLMLAGPHNLMDFTWLTAYAWLVVRAGDVLRRSAARAAIERCTGLVLIGFGLRLAVERR